MTARSIQTYKTVLMAVTTLFILATGCDDRFDPQGGNPSGEGEQVDVTLSIGLADEADGYELPGTPATKSRSDHDAAFSFDLLPSAQTKAGTSLKPDALYNLEIRQYDNNEAGSYKAGNAYDEVALGTKIEVTLTEAEHCQLVLIAWGAGNSRRLGTGNLSAVQDTIGSYLIDGLKPEDQADMNKMPYVLHLKNVNVSKDGRIYSQDGEAIDIRLRLQRLAARLTFSWDYKVDGYTPQQILIHSIPTQYKVIASPDKDNTYPSLLDQFTTIQLAKNTSTGSYSCWIPANVRGSNPAATSEAYRIKSNAPTGSSYIRFIAVDNVNPIKKLDYRIYLGGKETSDFNLYGNADYTYKAAFKHNPTELVRDLRVTIVDPIPASEGNNNFVPTANCFMVAPGGSFCFNPYKYTVGGAPTENTLLKGWCPSGTKIQSVRVLWQTLENGDVGDPVLGTVNSKDDHINIVDLKNGDSFENARIYCRVAPNTTGGSGVIAAYSGADGTGDILWSWHIWVTDYSPNATGDEDVQTPVNKRKQKYTWKDTDQLPMMDRNLGAFAGYDTVPPTVLERSKTVGFLYQWGRKDPFRASYSSKVIKSIEAGSISQPFEGLLSLYEGDGVTFYPIKTILNKSVGYKEVYQDPQNLYKPSDSNAMPWINNINADGYQISWGDASSKGLHDPCPAGWRVPKSDNFSPLFTGAKTVNTKNGNGENDGGVVISYDKERKYTSYFMYAGYWQYGTKYTGINDYGCFWSWNRAVNGTTGGERYYITLGNGCSGSRGNSISNGGYEKEALSIRCIQER